MCLGRVSIPCWSITHAVTPVPWSWIRSYPLSKSVCQVRYEKCFKTGHYLVSLWCNVKLIRYQFWCTWCAFRLIKSFWTVVLRPKKLEIPNKLWKCKRVGKKTNPNILCHEIEPNSTKDRAMHERDNPSIWDEFIKFPFQLTWAEGSSELFWSHFVRSPSGRHGSVCPSVKFYIFDFLKKPLCQFWPNLAQIIIGGRGF
jgi:hypothetical protein